MESIHQVVASKIPSSLTRGRLSSGLPRPTAVVQGEHQLWKAWLGKSVSISGAKKGTLLFYGKTQFAEGFFCGVALDEAEGKHDGCINGVRYFACPPNHGVMAPVTKVQRIGATSHQHNCTFILSPPKELPDSTFRIEHSPDTSPVTNETFCVEADKDRLHDITEDDFEESSLGILTASQMIDLSKELISCDIPKTQSCDDINELPEDEVVQNITVSYLPLDNVTFNLTPNSSFTNDLSTSTPVQKKEAREKIEKTPLLEVVSCSFQDITVDSLQEEEKPRDTIVGSGLEPQEDVADGLAEELELLNESIRNKLGELDSRVSIEAVMEVIQRQEMYKNRPASTYTVGSADTGYQGDGECDGRSETAGSPCEEVKPLSLCSQETDMAKSGHMSDSDFFTDQGASSELDLDPMKQSASSVLSSNMEDLSLSIPPSNLGNGGTVPAEEERNNNSSSADGEQTLVEESSVPSADAPKCSTSALGNNKRKDVSAGRLESAKRASNCRSKVLLPPPQEVKKVVRSPRKISRWDAVTLKIAAGLAEEKTKERKAVKSRVDTNLCAARTQLVRKNDSSHDTPSTIRGSRDGATDSVAESRTRANSEISSASSVAKIPSKIALPKRSLLERTRPTKGNVASNADAKRPRPARTPSLVSTLPQQQQQQKPKSTTETVSTQRNIPCGNANRAADCKRPAKLSADATSQSKTAPRSSSGRLAAKIEDLTAEVQRLGALCEQRTKELNMVKMQLKHTYCGFDAFAIMVGYLVGELDAFSHPRLLADMKKTREQLTSSLDLLGRYESELDSLRKQNAREVRTLLNDLSGARSQVEFLSNQLAERETAHQLELEELRMSCATEKREKDQRHSRLLDELRHRHDSQALELEETRRRHEAAVAELLLQLEERTRSLELQSRQFEETLRRDADSKMQWIYAKNAKLVAEADSLKSVMEMKQAEMHALRKENMQLRKELEELPLAQKQVENLRARNEDLQALVREKSKSERKMSEEAHNMKGLCEKVTRDNCRISMENEELQWKLQQTLDGSWTAYANEHPRSEMQLTPWRDTDEERPLATSPVDFFALCTSTASSPGKSPEGTSFVRRRHRSLGPHESAIYVKAQLEFEESDLLSRPEGAGSSSGESSCDPEDAGAPCPPSELRSPRSQAGEAMVGDRRQVPSEDELSCDSE